MRKRIVVLIALLMALILLFVGCAQADVTGTSAEDYREPIDEEFEDYELDDFFDDQEERYNAYPDSYNPEPCSDLEPTEDIGTYMNLNGMTIVAMAPFEGGVGWIQYMENGEMYTAAVETDGHVLFEIPGPVWYASAFEDGAAYVVISDNATYYPNADSTAGCYEQVAPAETHEEIYDIDGNLLYSTATGDAEGSHIICSGDGKYVILRHQAGLEFNSWQLGVIGQYGEQIYDFVEYHNVDQGILPTWKSKYSGTKKLPNKYGAGYGNGNDGDPGDGFSRYIGDGAFYLTGGSFGMLYQPEKQTVVSLKGTTLLSDVFDGKVLSYWNDTYYIQDINGSDANSVQALRDNQYVDIQHRGFSDGFRHLMADNLLYHDHAYYDINMNRVVEISDYTNLEMDGSIFNEGYALIALKGVDGNGYVTVIDESGTIQFEPIKAKKASQRISDGYFVVRTDTECAVYDVYGNYIRYLCPASDAEYIYDISGGHVTVNGFGTTRIFALNPVE